MTTLDALNIASPADFTAALAEVFEHAPWVAAQAATARPFPTVAALHAAMFAAVEAAPVEEQASLGLDGVDDAGFDAMNRDYRARFGIPFILCIRRHGRASLLR
ncbi:MAG: 2-oxo-4-hydroxy-4-carboxy-5-ureidoimidazoline decarboxylase [Janthinobacterium lividum]